MRQERIRIGSWGHPATRNTLLAQPADAQELSRELASLPGALTVRGMARSYGDAPLGRTTISTRLWRRHFQLDAESGVLEADAGWSLAEVVKRCLPHGWVPVILPGTGHVTLGGALACDVHGKNHHVDGAFSRWVDSIEVLLADGRLLRCSRDEEAGLFAACCGGMGFCGCITSVRIRLRRVTGDRLIRRSLPCNSIDATLQALREADDPFSVAWVDAASRKGKRGRSILHLGHWDDQDSGVRLHHKARLGPPRGWPLNMVRPFVIKAFNELVWRQGLRKAGREASQHYSGFFWPLDSLHAWNRLYGSNGLLQFQCLLPEHELEQHGARAFHDLLELFSRAGGGSLAVMKLMGPREALSAPIAFPGPGATLALDMPNTILARKAMRHAHRLVLNKGGRIYLAKDVLLEADEFREMNLDPAGWKILRDTWDPGRRWQSDLGRRLEL